MSVILIFGPYLIQIGIRSYATGYIAIPSLNVPIFYRFCSTQYPFLRIVVIDSDDEKSMLIYHIFLYIDLAYRRENFTGLTRSFSQSTAELNIFNRV